MSIAVAALVSVAAAGCAITASGTSPESAPTAQAGFAGYKWQVVTIDHAGKETPVPARYAVYLQFTPDGQFGSNEPVNYHSGAYHQAGDGFTTSGMGSTLAGYAGHDLADLRGGHLGRVIGRAGPDRVQRQGPRRAAGLHRGDDRVRPARDHLRVPFPPRIAVAEQPLRAGGRIGPQPVAYVCCQPAPAAAARCGLPAVQRVIHRSVAATALRLQRQLRHHVHPVHGGTPDNSGRTCRTGRRG